MSVWQQPRRREVVRKPAAVDETKMLEELNHKMSEGLDGAEEQVLKQHHQDHCLHPNQFDDL